MTQYLTLKGSRSLLSRTDIAKGSIEGRYTAKSYKGVTLYGLTETGADYPVWAVMGGEVFCLEPIEWPEEGAHIDGIVIVNPSI